MNSYSIGIDYGTLSARAILVRTDNGEIAAQSEFVYPHAVMDRQLPDGTPVEENAAFQHPRDYLDALRHTVRQVLETSGVTPEDVVGIGVDFTSCTMLPVDEQGAPLCFDKQFESQPHAYAKLWKHHSAQREADEITKKAALRGEPWLETYGGKVSSEWFFPKILETLRKAPQVYEHAAQFTEAGDWITRMLTGSTVRSSCMAGYKGMWSKDFGYPSPDFLNCVDPKLEHIVGTKISEEVLPTGTRAAVLNQAGSELTGLKPGTPVAVPIIDAHAALPAAGIAEAGKLMLIIGTSTCHIVMDKALLPIPGICGAVRDGIIPGLVAYEAGQAAVGDIFDWFVKNNVPASYTAHAQQQGVAVFDHLTGLAQALRPGQSGLIALDWWNGNRTPYADYDLKGVVLGYTLQTKPEELYRALIESTAFGTKAIVDLYQSGGIAINEICATGGISQKNPFLMQIYADVLGKPIRVPHISQAGAMGSAILAAFAGGAYPSVRDAAAAMVNVDETVYLPNPDNTRLYEQLYKKYTALSQYFSAGDYFK